jgi:hypothetical protein
LTPTSLEAPIDVTALLRGDDGDDAALAEARAAVQVVEGPRAERESIDVPNPGAATAPAEHNFAAAQNRRAGRSAAQSSSTGSSKPAATTASAPTQTNAPTAPALADILAAARQVGIDAARYERYATKRWGPGWKANATGRRRALEEIESFRECPAALATKIDAELDLFA